MCWGHEHMTKRDAARPAVIESQDTIISETEVPAPTWSLTCGECGYRWDVAVADFFRGDAWARCPRCNRDAESAEARASND